jgi:hypothetical protein
VIIATAQGRRADDGSPVTTLVLGFDDAALYRLREGSPIKVDGRVPVVAVPGLDLVIVAGRTEAELARTLRLQGASVAERPTDQPGASGNLLQALHSAGLHLIHGPNPDAEGRFPCADCGEPVAYEEGGTGLLVHEATGVHGCALGQGCAHIAVEIESTRPPQQGATPP